jgi:hypothetical protein
MGSDILVYQMFRTGFSRFEDYPTFVIEAVSDRDRFSIDPRLIKRLFACGRCIKVKAEYYLAARLGARETVART